MSVADGYVLVAGLSAVADADGTLTVVDGMNCVAVVVDMNGVAVVVGMSWCGSRQTVPGTSGDGYEEAGAESEQENMMSLADIDAVDRMDSGERLGVDRKQMWQRRWMARW